MIKTAKEVYYFRAVTEKEQGIWLQTFNKLFILKE